MGLSGCMYTKSMCCLMQSPFVAYAARLVRQIDMRFYTRVFDVWACVCGRTVWLLLSLGVQSGAV